MDIDDLIYRKSVEYAAEYITQQIRTAAYQGRRRCSALRTDVRFWAGVCKCEFGITVTPREFPPRRMNGQRWSDFKARLFYNEAHEFEIEYLATGTQREQIGRIVHELAESVLFVKCYRAGREATEARHESARLIEEVILAECFEAAQAI